MKHKISRSSPTDSCAPHTTNISLRWSSQRVLLINQRSSKKSQVSMTAKRKTCQEDTPWVSLDNSTMALSTLTWNLRNSRSRILFKSPNFTPFQVSKETTQLGESSSLHLSTMSTLKKINEQWQGSMTFSSIAVIESMIILNSWLNPTFGHP